MAIDRELVGGYAPDFELPGIDKQVYHLGRYLEKFKAIAVVFMDNQCPYVNKYLERLKELQEEFCNHNFTFVGINSNDSQSSIQEIFEEMQSFAQENNLSFPYLRDTTQDVAKSFGAKVIPEVFLLDKESVVRYAGSIDDNPDFPESVTKSYLREHISYLLSDEEVSPSYIEPIGTPIQWRKK